MACRTEELNIVLHIRTQSICAYKSDASMYIDTALDGVATNLFALVQISLLDQLINTNTQ